MRREELDRKRWQGFGGIFLVYLAYAIAALVTESWWKQVVGWALMAVFVWLYIIRLPARPWSARIAVALLVIELVYCLVVDAGGLVFGSYVAVGLVMSLPRRVSLPLVVGLAAGSTFIPGHIDGSGVYGNLYSIGGPIALLAIAMYTVRAKMAGDVLLDRAEDEIKHLAAEQERLRIARDLHDLLGHALTTVTVKAELASKLALVDAERAAREMAEVAELARQGLADVRAAVGGYREVSLATELASAREVLTAAGIVAELPPSTETVPRELRELFGWVVREGVTNAVRHSRARHLTVEVSRRAITVADDGGCDLPTYDGNGLSGLRARAASLGGTVSAAGDPSGFRLRVEVPA